MSRSHLEPADSVEWGIGTDAPRPDAAPKVTGRFPYASDLRRPDMLWGATLRSPHVHARIRSIDTAAARRLPGVHAVLTHEDVPGSKTYGLEHSDQPVLAWDTVRYQGEPIALVAAEDEETARRAVELIAVDYEELPALTDPEVALAGGAPPLHPDGHVVRHMTVLRGDPDAAFAGAAVVVRGTYHVGMQDQAFLGPESGLAVPAADGGVDLHVATQNLYYDHRQLVPVLGIPADRIRLTLAGVGGAFGGREDISVQIHLCLLALHCGRPVRMAYGREESFFGHVHRHPARLVYEHAADAEGRLLAVRARVLLDGGAYTSSSPAVCGNAVTSAVGPYSCANADLECDVVYTNNPPCGAMRGFGAVQTAFAYESQMDKLAAALGLDPVEVRLRNALGTGDAMPTGQVVTGPAPVAELLERLRKLPLPEPASGPRDVLDLPGGTGNVTRGESVRRGVGYAVGFKNVGFSAGAKDYSTATVRLRLVDGEPTVEVHTSAAELGQGGVTVQGQIARGELGGLRTVVLTADTQAGNSGSTAASRQTWLTGGAVRDAAAAVREELLRRAARVRRAEQGALRIDGGRVVGADGAEVPIAELLAEPVERTREYWPPATYPLDDNGQGHAHMAYQFSAHRAVVDVDVELGLVKVVELAAAQDVGRALNPLSVVGQIEGGSSQGLGLALMEEIQVVDGRIRNPSFTDYLIPTVLDMPPMRVELLETPHPDGPYGVNGMAEAPNISATPAVAAAVRAATGLDLDRVPIRPDDVAFPRSAGPAATTA